MQVVLTKDMKGVGTKHQILNVKPGYFMNFLFPKGLAKMVTPEMASQLKKVQLVKKASKEQLLSKATEFTKILETTPLEFTAKAETKKSGEVHTLYGSLSEKDVAQKINDDLHLPVQPDQVTMTAHIKTTGTHKVVVALSPKHKATVTILVKPE